MQAIYRATGRIYKVGTFRDTIYCAAGTSLDWSYGSAKIPFSYLIELRKGGKRFILPETQILDACKEATVATESLMKFVDESRKRELNQGIVVIQASKKPYFSKHCNNIYNNSITSENNDPKKLITSKIYKNKTSLSKSTSMRDVQSLSEWRVVFADNSFTKAIINNKTLSTKIKIPRDTKEF